MSKIEKGRRARELLEHPEFKDAIAIIRAENVNKWQRCGLKDIETQEECKMLDHAINELLKRFKRVLDDGKIEEDRQQRTRARKG